MQSSFATTSYSGCAGGGSDGRAGVGVCPPKPAVGGACGVASLAGAGRGAPQLAEESTDNGPKEGRGFNKGFLSYKYPQSPLLRNYGHPVKLWTKVHMCGGHGGEDEGQDAEDFHGEAVTMIVPSWAGWQLI